MRQLFWSPLLAVCLLFNSWIHTVVCAARCPTLGIDSYALVVVSAKCTPAEFVQMVEVFANTSSQCTGTFEHHVYFGNDKFWRADNDHFYDEIQKWTAAEIDSYHNASKTNAGNALAAYHTIQNMLENENKKATAVKKKTVTIISDHIDKELFVKANALNETNTELFVYTDWSNLEGFDKTYGNIKPLLSMEGTSVFCNDIPYEWHTTHKSAKANINIYLTDLVDPSTTGAHVSKVLQGELCALADSEAMSDYATVYHGKESVSLPWVGNQTVPFAKQCVNSLYRSQPKTRASRIRGISCTENESFFDSLLKDLLSPASLNTFNVVIGADLPDCFISMISSAEKCSNCTNIFLDVLIDSANQNEHEVYSHVYKPLSRTHMFTSRRDNHVTTNGNALTACRRTLSAVPLHKIGPYVPPKSLSRALERFS